MDYYYRTHWVSQGETLSSIASLHGWTGPRALTLFRRNNGIGNPDLIRPGDPIAIPYSKKALMAWQEHYKAAMQEASQTMNEYNSVSNQAYRAVRQAFDTVEGWFDMFMDGKSAVDAAKLVNKLEHLNGKVLAIAQGLIALRATNTAIAGLDKFIEVVQWLSTQLNGTLQELNSGQKARMEQGAKVAKAMLRHAEILLEIYEGFWKQSGIKGAVRNRKVLFSPMYAGPKDMARAFTGLAGKTVDHVFLAGKVGFWMGDLLASCTSKADLGLFFYGFSEYDSQIGKDLERVMIKRVEMAQTQLSRIHMQLNTPVYQYA